MFPSLYKIGSSRGTLINAMINLNVLFLYLFNYNLRPTVFAHVWSNASEDPVGYAGAGFSHAIGTAFRWKVLSVGPEYVIGNINCEYIDTNYDYTDQKLVISNFRLMIGAKF